MLQTEIVKMLFEHFPHYLHNIENVLFIDNNKRMWIELASKEKKDTLWNSVYKNDLQFQKLRKIKMYDAEYVQDEN